jgi:membrane protease YdiL (CAAX protease family)
LVAPLQEVLAKSVMYYSFELCFERRHPHLVNAMAALTFGLFHVVYGAQMMLVSMALSLITGWIFQKYRCVWGCAAAHFAVGLFYDLFSP